ncbi:class III aminotransferase [Poronia punctata]|nr:class III aminotransferase [Poronia punctata]
MTDSIGTAYEAAEARYKTSNPRSGAAHRAATASLPGGNTRSVLHWSPYPLCIASASGYRLRDADGHDYVDLLGEYSAGIYGHSHPVLLSAVTEALAGGIGYGGPHVAERRLAELIRERFESVRLVRFTNSGTEANLLAIAAAKRFTGRWNGKVVVFEGAYHGGVLVFPFGCGDVWNKKDEEGGGEGEGRKKYEGLRALNVPHDFVVARYNDVDSVDAALASSSSSSSDGGGIAAILLEPMLGSGGGICATDEFLRHLRRRADETGALLILDEVMTSRSYSGGGIQSEMKGVGVGVRPDLTTLGKYMGGGMSFGAFGGREDVMGVFDPRDAAALPHAGTFNNNVLTMNAGIAGLERVFTTDKARALHVLGDEVRERINKLGDDDDGNDMNGDAKQKQKKKKKKKLRVMGCGSILVFHFTAKRPEEILSPADWKGDEDPRLLDLFHLEMLSEGFYLARRGYAALSLLFLEEDGRREIERFVGAVEGFLERFGSLL